MPNVAINEFVTPSEKTIDFIYKGLLAFYPEIAAPIFDLPKESYGSLESWAGFDKFEFLEFVFDITAQYRLTTDLEEAVGIIRDWKKGYYPEITVPIEINQLVADIQEDIETRATPYAIREKVKAVQLSAKRAKEIQQARQISSKLPPGPTVIIPSPVREPLLKESPPLYIEPTETLPPPPEMARITQLLRKSAQTPEGYQREKEELLAKVLQEAKKNLPRVFKVAPPDQLEKVVGAIVDETMRRLVEGPSAVQIPDPQVLTPLADPENLMGLIPDPELRRRLADTAAKLKKLTETGTTLAQALIKPVLGPEITDNLFPSSETQYRVTPVSTEKTVLIIGPRDFVANPPTPSLLTDLVPREHFPERAPEIGPVETKPAPTTLKETTLPPELVTEPEIKEPVTTPSTTAPTVSIPISTIPPLTVGSSSELVTPSESTVDFLYSGLLAIDPETATAAFDLPREGYKPTESWAGFEREEFSKFVCKITGSNDLSEASVIVRNWREGVALDRKIPAVVDKIVSKLDQINAEKGSDAELQVHAHDAFIESQKWEQIPPTSGAVKEELKVPIYLEPSKPIPTPEFTENDLIALQAGVALQDPKQYVVDLTKTIVDRVNETAPEYAKTMTPDELQAVAETLATRTAHVIRGEYRPAEPSHWALTALADSNDPILVELFPDSEARLKFVEAIQGRALALEATDTLDRDLLYRVFGKEIGEKLLGPEGPIKYTLTETKTENSEFELRPGEFLKAHETYLENIRSYREALESGDQDFIQRSTYKALSTFRSKATWARDTKGVLPVGLFKTTATGAGAIAGYKATMSLAAIWESSGVPIVPLVGGGFLNVVTTSVGTKMLVTPFIKFVDLNLGPVGFVHIGFGHIGVGTVAPELAGRAVQGVMGQAGKPAVAVTAKIAGKTISAISTKLGAILAKVATLLGASSTAVGNVLGVIIGAIVGKVLEKTVVFIQKHKETFTAILFSPLVLAGIILGIPALTIAGGLGVGIALSGGVGKFATSAGNFVIGLIKGITSLSMASIGTPLLISVISIPVLVAIILFIINSGAYLVPPKTGFEPGVVVSQYIDVTKTVNPTGPFSNSDLPKTIEYTVTIKAKKSTLSNIRISDLCDTVSKKAKPNCPAPNPSLPKQGDANFPDKISPSENGFSFKYKRTFTSPNFEDTLVVDTITAVADVPEKQDDMASSGVSIKFGNPPEECPNGWPILPEVGESHLDITQGPLGSYSHSQAKLEAIDIGATIGHTITARHSGIVKVHVDDFGNYGPKYVDIISSCNGKSFSSRYAHLSAVTVTTGQSVTLGQKIGYSGTSAGGAHLHYEFLGLKMTPKCTADVNYRCIPKSVPYGCAENCGTVP